MSVVANRTGTNAVVTITTDVADILAAVGISNAEKKAQAMRRVLDELTIAVANHARPDNEIDAEATRLAADATADAARKKAVKPTGTL